MDLNDLCKLENVDEESVIDIIRKRYENGLFYVRTSIKFILNFPSLEYEWKYSIYFNT